MATPTAHPTAHSHGRAAGNVRSATPLLTRQQLPGTTQVSIPHMYSPESHPPIQVSLQNYDLQYSLEPKYIGHDANKQPILYLDAQNPDFYYQTLPSPVATIWLIMKDKKATEVIHPRGYSKRRVIEEAIKQNIQIRLLAPTGFDLSLPIPSPCTHLSYMGVPLPLPSMVLSRMGANVDYAGLSLFRHFDALGIHVFNRYRGLQRSRDKFYTHQVVAGQGIPVPVNYLYPPAQHYHIITNSNIPTLTTTTDTSQTSTDTDTDTSISTSTSDSSWLSRVESRLTYPMIIKLASGSLGAAVWCVADRTELVKLLATLNPSQPIIFQQFLSATRGRDLRCLVLGDRLIASMMRTASTGFKANVELGGTVSPCHAGRELTQLAIDTSAACSLDMSGVDILIDHDTYKICEVNASPLFEGLEKATHVNVAKAILEYMLNTHATIKPQQS